MLACRIGRDYLARMFIVAALYHFTRFPDPDALRGMHVLIIDDVVTTGSTVEGCIKALGQVPGLRASLFTAACA